MRLLPRSAGRRAGGGSGAATTLRPVRFDSYVPHPLTTPTQTAAVGAARAFADPPPAKRRSFCSYPCRTAPGHLLARRLRSRQDPPAGFVVARFAGTQGVRHVRHVHAPGGGAGFRWRGGCPELTARSRASTSSNSSSRRHGADELAAHGADRTRSPAGCHFQHAARCARRGAVRRRRLPARYSGPSAHFDVIRIEGVDYRHRGVPRHPPPRKSGSAGGSGPRSDARPLRRCGGPSGARAPVSLRAAGRHPLYGMDRCEMAPSEQDKALRFVVLVDRLYDNDVPAGGQRRVSRSRVRPGHALRVDIARSTSGPCHGWPCWRSWPRADLDRHHRFQLAERPMIAV